MESLQSYKVKLRSSSAMADRPCDLCFILLYLQNHQIAKLHFLSHPMGHQ